MKEFNVHHAKGTIIANVQAKTEKQALKLAQKLYGPTVYVSSVR